MDEFMVSVIIVLATPQRFPLSLPELLLLLPTGHRPTPNVTIFLGRTGFIQDHQR